MRYIYTQVLKDFFPYGYVYKLHEMNVYSVVYGRFSKDDEYWECGGRLPHLVSELRVGSFFLKCHIL